MSKKFKLYVPLINPGKLTMTLVGIDKVPSLRKVAPGYDEILMNLSVQSKRVGNGIGYRPIVRKVTQDTFSAIENEIRAVKPGHKFMRRALDIVGSRNGGVPLVQVYEEIKK